MLDDSSKEVDVVQIFHKPLLRKCTNLVSLCPLIGLLLLCYGHF